MGTSYIKFDLTLTRSKNTYKLNVYESNN